MPPGSHVRSVWFIVFALLLLASNAIAQGSGISARGAHSPSVVTVEPASLFVVHDPFPQTTDETLVITNQRLTSVQFTIIEAPSDCANPGTLGWLSAAPNAGTIAGGQSRTVTVLFASADLPAGYHSALLCIHTTDEDNPLIEVPVQLHVGALPTATATATSEPPPATATETTAPSTPTAAVTHSPTATIPHPTATATATPPPTHTASPTGTATRTLTVTATVTITTTPGASSGYRLYLPVIRRR